MQRINRRKFIRSSAGIVGLAAIQPASLFSRPPADDEIKLTILHTNDWHSRIDPFPADDPKYPGMGGAARRASLINSIRNEGNHVLLLDAGDVFQGTPYFNYYGGEPEFRLMSAMGYDAATLGNHDFDNGIDGLVKMLPFAEFPFLNCNYDFGKTALRDKIHEYKIIRKGPLKIGVTGVGIDLQGLVPDKNFEGIHYNNPVAVVDKQAERLKKSEGCDMVICLSHLGYEYPGYKMSDRILASNSQYIDLIIGGHTHTFLDTPQVVANKAGKPVIINQVGWAGLRLGRIDYFFSSRNNVKNQAFARIEVFKKSIAI
ncbi:MAG: metallophosphoesterase [Bacteroidia bacterium]